MVIVRKYYYLVVCIVFLYSSQLSGQEQEITYHKIERVYSVIPETNSYVSKNYIQGTCKAGTKNKVSIYYGELSSLSEIKAAYKEFGKWQKISKKKMVSSSVLTNSFYDGFRKTTFAFPNLVGEYDFNYSYEKTTNEMLMLSSLDFRDANKTDTIAYKILLPLTHKLHFQFQDSLKNAELVTVSERQKNDKMEYAFIAIPDKAKKYPTTRAASIRLIITPKSKDPFDHYNDWYYELVRPKTNLNEVVKSAVRNEVLEMDNDLERIETVFNWIKDRTSYVAFEDGIGAFQPRDVNKTFTSQQGDCKDMSNLLCQALRTLGYDAKIAISSTIDHSFKLDFASVSSANHAICVLEHEGDWLFMDATEDSGFFGFPSRQIQGRNVFIVDDNEGMLQSVPVVKATDNTVHHEINLKEADNGLKGEIHFTYNGLSQIKFRDANKRIASSRLEENLKRYLGEDAKNLVYEDVTLHIDETICEIKADVMTERNFTSIKNKKYLSLAFLPYPHQKRIPPKDAKVLQLSKADDGKFEVKIDFENEIKLHDFESISIQEDGIHFSFDVNQIDPKQIVIKYNYCNEILELKGKSLETFREVNKQIKKTFSKSIIYEQL